METCYATEKIDPNICEGPCYDTTPSVSENVMSVIGQLTGQSLQQQRNKKVGYPLYPFWLRLLQEEGKLSSRRRSLQGFAQRESLQAIRFCLSHFLGTIATQTLTGRRLVPNKSFASVRGVCAIRSSAMADGGNKLMTRVTTGLGFAAASARGAKRLSLSFPFSLYPTPTTV